MLCELKIENLALIESLRLNFELEDNGRLIVMTGETGAGKSIMLRAIKLLTGVRASIDWIRNGAENCTIEALFEVNPDHKTLLESLEAGGFGTGTTVIIKRVININGRSRLYINGSLATGKIVTRLTDNMLNIASQHDHQQLLQPSRHLDFLDTLGELWEARNELSQLHEVWMHRKEEYRKLRQHELDKEEKKDLLLFQVDDINQAEIEPGEDERLSAEKKRLKSADMLIKLSQESFSLLSTSVMDKLVQIRKSFEQVAELDPQAAKLSEQLNSYSYEAEDYIVKLRNYRDSLESDPLQLERVTERIDQLQQLKRKYGQSLDQVLEFGRQAEKQLLLMENMDKQLQELRQVVEQLSQELETKAAELSVKRKQVAKTLEITMAKELSSLNFSRSGFEVHWQDVEQSADAMQDNGWDRVAFYFSANPGEMPRPLAKVASGGELSRLMLAMKCLLAKKDMVETVIFDEVDAGVGGEAAEAVARKIQELATHHQVFCITHLPQIAARGSGHFLVSKTVEEGRTLSTFSRLEEHDRVFELVRMLAGDSATPQTLDWAEELLRKGRNGE